MASEFIFMNLNQKSYMKSGLEKSGTWEPSQFLLEVRGKPRKPACR
jgi:hypothetical protein